MSDLNPDQTRNVVREHYAKVSTKNVGCAPGCCGPMPTDQSLSLGYTEADLAAVPDGADLGLGCGNPNAIAALALGETVLDLGAGGGFDCFLAARAVGPTGKVIGVDMTPQMISKARAGYVTGGKTFGYDNVRIANGERGCSHAENMHTIRIWCKHFKRFKRGSR